MKPGNWMEPHLYLEWCDSQSFYFPCTRQEPNIYIPKQCCHKHARLRIKKKVCDKQRKDQTIENREDQCVCLDDKWCLTLITVGNQTMSESTEMMTEHKRSFQAIQTYQEKTFEQCNICSDNSVVLYFWRDEWKLNTRGLRFKIQKSLVFSLKALHEL